MRICTFNVNGIRSLLKKKKDGTPCQDEKEESCIHTLVSEQKLDVLCLQEIKTDHVAHLDSIAGLFRHSFVNPCKGKKGYSGVAIFCNETPEWYAEGFELFEEERIGKYKDFACDQEGRLVAVKFASYIVVNVYVPNAQPELARIQERVRWEELLRRYVTLLEGDEGVPVILCGDLNVAPEDRDIHRKQPKGTPGTSLEERREFAKWATVGFVDAYRLLYPQGVAYSYWSHFGQAREKGKGWRIDLFLVSERAKGQIKEVQYLEEYRGSDHGPVVLEIAME